MNINLGVLSTDYEKIKKTSWVSDSDVHSVPNKNPDSIWTDMKGKGYYRNSKIPAIPDYSAH